MRSGVSYSSLTFFFFRTTDGVGESSQYIPQVFIHLLRTLCLRFQNVMITTLHFNAHIILNHFIQVLYDIRRWNTWNIYENHFNLLILNEHSNGSKRGMCYFDDA